MKFMKTKPYEVCDALQQFLLNNENFEIFLNTLGFTNSIDNDYEPINYVHYPKQQTSITTFPFISFEANENIDARAEEDGFRWYVEIVIGLKDITEDNPNHNFTKTDNVLKYTKTRDVQTFGLEILKAIEEEIEISGIKGDFEINFGKISQSTTPTGEFDEMYHLIELELISYKEI